MVLEPTIPVNLNRLAGTDGNDPADVTAGDPTLPASGLTLANELKTELNASADIGKRVVGAACAWVRE